MSVHFEPFHDSTRLTCGTGLFTLLQSPPTAMQRVGDGQSTPFSESNGFAGFARLITDHRFPFQCSAL